MGDWFTAIASKETYPFIVVWYSGILNYIVLPADQMGDRGSLHHGGRQEPGRQRAHDRGRLCLGRYRDHVIQPFWAIPSGVAKLDLRYHGLLHDYFLIYMVIVSVGFLLLPVFFSV